MELREKNLRASPSSWIRLAALGFVLSIALQAVRCEPEPTESQCRPYIEKALKQQQGDPEETVDETSTSVDASSEQGDLIPTDELTETTEDINREEGTEEERLKEHHADDAAEKDETEIEEGLNKSEEVGAGEEQEREEVSNGEGGEIIEGIGTGDEGEEAEKQEEANEEEEEEETERERVTEPTAEGEEETDGSEREGDEMQRKESEDGDEGMGVEEKGRENEENEGSLETERSEKAEAEAREEKESEEEVIERADQEEVENQAEQRAEETAERDEEDKVEEEEDKIDAKEGSVVAEEGIKPDGESGEKKAEDGKSDDAEIVAKETAEKGDAEQTENEEGDKELTPEEDLTKEVIVPENLRPREHITKILRLDEEHIETESALDKANDATLRNLKNLYDSAIKPLEMLYKYRDLSNRHFGDPEIFSKPLILFMGPWSGGKSSTINYLLDNEFTQVSLRTGAEPSPAYFNILMYGKEEEVLDGTQLAADWTFSGLQKFGQGLLDRLKGFKLPNRLLEKVNIVEIPGILEIRKQVQRLFPFNDACQWFIDRADIIFLVYDPSKLDVGPETEAILDQLKGREYQTRIILNKADQVKPEELMRVQGTLIWNISPLMSSTEPPIMYSTSLWSMPYESGAPTRLLQAQEQAFLRDLRDAIDKRVENKIASARRFAVRVRNHAKMVDCYLTTYYNHKTFFGNKKKISDDIIENPQKYHIYEGLSTLTNISRYDLPDPDVYRDFFKINPLYDFAKLSDTCTYFRGCPINKLDVAIAYDLPELVGKHKKAAEASKTQAAHNAKS